MCMRNVSFADKMQLEKQISRLKNDLKFVTNRNHKLAQANRILEESNQELIDTLDNMHEPLKLLLAHGVATENEEYLKLAIRASRQRYDTLNKIPENTKETK